MGVVSANISIFAAVAEREHTLTLATILLPTLDVLLLKNWKLKNREGLLQTEGVPKNENFCD